MDVVPRILLLFLLIFLNGFFVASEYSLIAVRKTRIELLVRKGNRSARLVQKALRNIGTYISATQLGITLVSLALGWVGEPLLADLIEPLFLGFMPNGLAFASAHGVAIGIAFVLITFLDVVLGELSPKTMALQKAEQISLFTIVPLLVFTTVFKPFIWLLNESGALVLKLLGFIPPTNRQLVHSEEEIKMILAQSAEEGAIDKEEAEMVYSVFKLGDIPVSEIMVPKEKIVSFEASSSLHSVIRVIQKSSHSRFPVYEGSLDNVIGFVHVKDIYRTIVEEGSYTSIRDLYKSILRRDKKILSQIKIRKIPRVRDITRVDDVLVALRRGQVHIAIVEKESGKTAGIVTLEDTVESLVGEIHDEFEDLSEEKQSLLKKVIKKF